MKIGLYLGAELGCACGDEEMGERLATAVDLVRRIGGKNGGLGAVPLAAVAASHLKWAVQTIADLRGEMGVQLRIPRDPQHEGAIWPEIKLWFRHLWLS